MVKALAATLLILTVLFSFNPAHAGLLPLVNNGGNLIYDPNLKITWYDPVPTAMNWYDATNWAASLTIGGTTAGSWSLPTTAGTQTGYTDEGQMGYLFCDESGILIRPVLPIRVFLRTFSLPSTGMLRWSRGIPPRRGIPASSTVTRRTTQGSVLATTRWRCIPVTLPQSRFPGRSSFSVPPSSVLRQ